MLTFIPIVIVVALIVVFAGVKNCAAGVPMDGRTLRPLYQNADAGPEHGGAVHGPHRP